MLNEVSHTRRDKGKASWPKGSRCHQVTMRLFFPSPPGFSSEPVKVLCMLGESEAEVPRVQASTSATHQDRIGKTTSPTSQLYDVLSLTLTNTTLMLRKQRLRRCLDFGLLLWKWYCAACLEGHRMVGSGGDAHFVGISRYHAGCHLRLIICR